MAVTLDEPIEEIRLAGNTGFWAVLALAVLLGIHPFGTTDLYDDGPGWAPCSVSLHWW